MSHPSPHKFHIPVMGLAFTIDSPIKVARFGIASVISIIEDNLVEAMREYYYGQSGKLYIAISNKEDDYRSRRITDYLDLVNTIVNEQVAELKAMPFAPGSEINKYFELLPEDSHLKNLFHMMSLTPSNNERESIEQFLRSEIRPGSIEVNIMTKLDKNNMNKNGEIIEDGSDALSALKGYVKSGLTNSSVVFSAGMNPRLYNYLERFREFDAKSWGEFDKKVVIKVSDYRSALIQGKFLAKKGIWVSEFRIESGLNCGGHAFATDGLLLGPILEEFKSKRDELSQELSKLYNAAVEAKGNPIYDDPHPIKISVQGGIGTYEEDHFLHEYYGLDSTGWGTPFLLCPEATTVDEETLGLLTKAQEKDVVLSKNSPLGIRFNYLKGTSSDLEKQERIKKGSPGSPCTEKFLVSNTEFTDEPICTASKKYQKLKISQLQSLNLPEMEYEKQATDVYSKECLCIGLSNAIVHQYNQNFVKKLKAVTICPGPNIAYFSRLTTLQEMADHIYGRSNILQRHDRPHMFVKELQLYVDYLKEQIADNFNPDNKFIKYCSSFGKNLLEGINYYEGLLNNESCSSWRSLLEQPLADIKDELENLLKNRGLLSMA